MTQDVCKRNCWIAGAGLGLLVLLLTWSGMGLAGALFLAIIAGALFGAMLVWLVCSGERGSEPRHDADERPPAGGRSPSIDRDHDPGPAETALMGTAQARGPVIPVGQTAPPTSIVAGAPRGQALSQGAVSARPGAGQAPTFGGGNGTAQAQASGQASALRGGQPGAPRGASHREPEPLADDSPLEDTRAVMDDPSESQDHRMPGEAVPAAEPGGVQDQQPPRGPDMEDLNDAAAADGSAATTIHERSGKVRVTDAGPRA